MFILTNLNIYVYTLGTIHKIHYLMQGYPEAGGLINSMNR